MGWLDSQALPDMAFQKLVNLQLLAWADFKVEGCTEGSSFERKEAKGLLLTTLLKDRGTKACVLVTLLKFGRERVSFNGSSVAREGKGLLW